MNIEWLMLASRYPWESWAPDGKYFSYVSFDVSEVHKLEYTVYPEHLAASNPYDVDENSFDQYSRMNEILYAKSLGIVPKTHLWIYNLETEAKNEVYFLII